MNGRLEAAAALWSGEHAGTARVLRAIPAGSLDLRPAPASRTLGDLAWHLPTSERWFATGALGLRVPGADPVPKDLRPADPAAIADAADRSHALLLEAFRGQDDGWLAEEVEFYGRRMVREAVVGLMLRHEAHHRGQLTVYLRLAGGKVPGVYGPSADDAG